MAEIIQYACGMSNGFFVKGDKGVIAVDTGDLYGEDVAQKIFEENGINPKDVILIIITHGHPDHMRNVEAFKKLTGAPVLMTSVDTDPALCALERTAVLQRLGAGEWKIFGAHGMMKEYNLQVE